MTIDEAIEILRDLDTTLPQSDPCKRQEAVKLGIEALKFRLDLEQEDPEITLELLPGETEHQERVSEALQDNEPYH